MIYNELFGEFKKLSAAEKQRFLTDAKNELKWANRSLHPGAKVQFRHSKTGAYISGIFIRMKTKYAEMSSYNDQNGLKRSVPITWSVSPELLIPLTAEQAQKLGL